MSTVYEQLSLGGGIDQIDFRQYIQNLIAMLSKSYLPPGGLVSIETQLDEVWLDAKRALPLGLILNELINNALKHAFPEGSAPGGAPGIISVELTKADSQVTLRVADNGVGLMKRASSASSGMGLSLVEMLSRQIGGSFTSESGEGYAALVSFNL